MTTRAVISVPDRSWLVRSIAVAAGIVGTLDFVYLAVVEYLTAQISPIVILQYNASGALGNAAFAGGLATALIGLIFHLVVSFAVAAVFLLSAYRLPLLRRHIILGGLLYGVAVYVVMNLIVLPLSAAPKLPFSMPALILGIVGHMLFVGLPLALVAQRTANAYQ